MTKIHGTDAEERSPSGWIKAGEQVGEDERTAGSKEQMYRKTKLRKCCYQLMGFLAGQGAKTPVFVALQSFLFLPLQYPGPAIPSAHHNSSERVHQPTIQAGLSHKANIQMSFTFLSVMLYISKYS